jgi:hypothetical protein
LRRQPYLLPAVSILMVASVAAALSWAALIWITARGSRPRAGSTLPRLAPGARWLVAGAVIIPTVAFGASLIAVLSAPGLPVSGP